MSHAPPPWSSQGGAREGPLFGQNSLKTRLKYIKITLKFYFSQKKYGSGFKKNQKRPLKKIIYNGN